MFTETDVLGIIGSRLEKQGIPFMLTGSFALGYYATPRMTRDLDIVVSLQPRNTDALVAAFSVDFYIDGGAAKSAIESESLFNLMHFDSGIKVDFIVRKSSEYRRLEFERRHRVTLGDAMTWIVSREDLILSKLVWAMESQSELQRRDVRQLLAAEVDMAYLNRWANVLGVAGMLRELVP